MKALLRLPQALPRFVSLHNSTGRQDYIAIEEMIGLFIDELYPEYILREKGMFRLVQGFGY